MKSALFEYYQKEKGNPPVFQTKRAGGTDHLPQFQSTVTLSDGTQHSGNHCATKKEAENSAAKMALDSLSSTNINKKEVSKLPVPSRLPESPPAHLGRIVCIIDYENLPNMLDSALRYSHLFEQIYVVIGDHHHKSDQEFPGAAKILCPSMAANAADLCIAMMVGSLLQVSRFDTYVLVSRDKFVAPIFDMITKPTTVSGGVVWKVARADIATKPAHLDTLFCT